MQATALIAEDEPLLAAALQAALAKAWPELRVVATVGDGASAVQAALAQTPEVLFFDIRMPGLGGLEAAAELADAWDTQGPAARSFPALVFVTAYDQYAVQAFEAQAVDYLLKPVQADRLRKTVERVQQLLARRSEGHAPGAEAPAGLDATLAQLRHLLQGAGGPAGTAPVSMTPPAFLQTLQVGVGTTIRMVPVDEVLYFEAADKYVRVLTAGHEYLLRTPLRELMAQIDPQQFWQVHRGTVVRAQAIAGVQRDEGGKSWLQLHGSSDRLAVSRLYSHLFKAM
jgi:DNA-binding LytR/AlgR family response regulator